MDRARLTEAVFPIGHYMGAFHPAFGASMQHYVVRVGWDTRKLPDDAHRDIWLLAHGTTLPDDGPVTRQALAGEARGAGMDDVDGIIDALIGRGLLAVVGPQSDDAVAFANAYRMQVLLVGVDDVAGSTAAHGIGLPGVAPLLRVQPREFEIWQWGHLWPSIWSACEGLAEVARDEGAEPAASNPRQILTSVLSALRTLLARHAIYLDEAQDEPSGG